MSQETGAQGETNKSKNKYFYDKTWLKNILKNQCPECENLPEKYPRGQIIKKGILRTCNQQKHLYIYGNPILVAYNKKIDIDLDPLDYKKCPECGSEKFHHDIDRHETYCKCGLVLKAPPEHGIIHPWHDNFEGVE